MNQNLLRLAKRREHLVEKAEAQRLALAQNVEVWSKPLTMADQGLNVLRYIRNHPIMIAGGGTAVLSMLRPSRFGKWFRRGWLAWQILQKLSNKSKP
ncbi:MAG: hypothetical protein EXR38_01350 [Methylotenera sp.]|nr:hypothetical protein [Methylotenera sp.]MSP99150.1 hypothetical protein [Methylotenera sp.]